MIPKTMYNSNLDLFLIELPFNVNLGPNEPNGREGLLKTIKDLAMLWVVWHPEVGLGGGYGFGSPYYQKEVLMYHARDKTNNELSREDTGRGFGRGTYNIGMHASVPFEPIELYIRNVHR